MGAQAWLLIVAAAWSVRDGHAGCAGEPVAAEAASPAGSPGTGAAPDADPSAP